MHIYEVLKRPIITEKSVYSAENLGVSRYAFEVDLLPINYWSKMPSKPPLMWRWIVFTSW